MQMLYITAIHTCSINGHMKNKFEINKLKSNNTILNTKKKNINKRI